MPSRDEIFEKVKAALVDALGVEEDDVAPAATMVGDLGAESIDFLDIVFRLEKSFGVKIPQGELFPDNALSDPRYVQDGKLTADGLVLLKERLPHVDTSSFAADPRLEKVAESFTVKSLVDFMERKLQPA
jgi:acyl carrier protein